MLSTCKVPKCNRKVRARQFCLLHWERQKHGRPLEAPLYYNRVEKRGWMMGGYHWISTSEGEILEHRWIVERALSRKLDTDEIVHHRNGDKLDNRIENLEILGRAEHTSLHRIHRKPCIICGKDDVHQSRGLCGKHAARARRAEAKKRGEQI